MTEMIRYSLVFQASVATCSHHIEGHGKGDVTGANTEADRGKDQTHRKISSYLGYHPFPLNKVHMKGYYRRSEQVYILLPLGHTGQNAAVVFKSLAAVISA